jgi:HAT1-interacting factor 1
MLGESKAVQKRRIEQATATANDLSGMVKHRKKPKRVEGAEVVEGKGKRKAEEVEEGVNGHGGGKKVKFAEESGDGV